MKPQSNKPQLIASIHCDESDRAYRVTEIQIWSVGPSRHRSNLLFRCHWQSSVGHDGWYGARTKIEMDRDNLGEQLPKVAKFFAKFPLTNSPKEWLASTGVPIRVWDGRCDAWVDPSKVLSSDYGRWMAMGRSGGCCVSVVATEAFAQTELMREFARNADRSWCVDGLKHWISQGQPVVLDRFNVMPVVPNIDQCFRSLGDEHRARVEAEQERILELQEAEAEAERLANAVAVPVA